MNLKLETEFSKADILHDVDALKKQIDDMRPLPEDVEGRVMQKLRLDWNYHSNAIEGNRLTYGETVAFLMEGITAKGKPLKDHLDIRGHNEAVNFLLSIVKDTRPISEADIRNLHKMILVEQYTVNAQTTDGLPTTKIITPGEYKTQPNHVKTATGEIHYYATPEETPAQMQELMEWYNEVSNNKEIHPVVAAALFHHKFVSIHPFDDGNGRMSRILMNLILMQHGYPPVVIKMDDRQNYYALLSRADNGENWPFIEYIAELLQNSLDLYLKAASGGDIDEDEDIDKEIALFRLQIQNEVTVKQKKSLEVIRKVLDLEFSQLLTKLFKTVSRFSYDFIDYYNLIYFKFRNGFEYKLVRSIDLFVLNEIGENLNYCEIIEWDITFINFKNPKNDFTIESKGYIYFDEYKFEVYGNRRDLILSKLYHENLSDQDKKDVIRNFVDDIKTQIQDNLNIENQIP